MGSMGGGSMNVLGGSKTVTLANNDGSDALTVVDASGFILWRIKSDGVQENRGKIQRVRQ